MDHSYLVLSTRFIVKTLLPITRFIPSKRVQAAGLGLALAFPVSSKSIKKYIKPKALQNIPSGLADFIAQHSCSNVCAGTDDAENIFRHIFPHLSTLSEEASSDTLRYLIQNQEHLSTDILQIFVNRAHTGQQKKDLFLQLAIGAHKNKAQHFVSFVQNLYFQWQHHLNGGDCAYSFHKNTQNNIPLNRKQRMKQHKKTVLYISRCIHYVDCVILNHMLENIELSNTLSIQNIPYTAFEGLFERKIDQKILDTIEQKWGVNSLLNVHWKRALAHYDWDKSHAEKMEHLDFDVAKELNFFFERKEAQRVKQLLLNSIEQQTVECTLNPEQHQVPLPTVSRKRKM